MKQTIKALLKEADRQNNTNVYECAKITKDEWKGLLTPFRHLIITLIILTLLIVFIFFCCMEYEKYQFNKNIEKVEKMFDSF